jgi:UDP-perosamine 4-acetyltransferase
MSAKPLILIGAGGHAKVVVDALASQGRTLAGFVDTNPAPWLGAIPHLSEQELEGQLAHVELVMGFVGLQVASLDRRLQVQRSYTARGAVFPPVIHATATLGSEVALGAGVQVLAGAIVNAHALIGEAAIINTAAVVEHDAHVGAGSHIAPRAVVLGGARVGELCFVGCNAVIIQNAKLNPHSFVKALSIHQ